MDHIIAHQHSLSHRLLSHAYIVFGDAGNDTVAGYDGDDKLFGGADNDRLYGGNDNDTMDGDAGDDVLYGGNGNDDMDGGPGRRSLQGRRRPGRFGHRLRKHLRRAVEDRV